MNTVPWRKGERGEWYVVLQVALFFLVVFGPRGVSGLPAWSTDIAWVTSPLGIALIVLGALILVAGGIRLGANLTPLPMPKDNGTLIQTGVYSIVRHPMYSGGLWMAVGWALWTQGIFTLGYAALLFVFIDVKSRREERWLSERFPDYSGYQRRIRKLIPFVY